MRYELDFFTDGAVEKDRRLPGSLFGELTVGRQVWMKPSSHSLSGIATDNVSLV